MTIICKQLFFYSYSTRAGVLVQLPAHDLIHSIIDSL